MNTEDKVRKADDILYGISREFHLYACLNPTNRNEERERFLDAVDRRKRYEPVFEYDPLPSGLGKWKKMLDSIVLDASPLERVYQESVRELGEMMALAEARGTPTVTDKSTALFGEPSGTVMAEAEKILSGSTSWEDEPSEVVGIKGLVERLRERLRHDRIEGWDVVEDPSCLTLAEVDAAHRKIHLQSGMIITDLMVKRLLIHLIEGHVYRAANGSRQPFKLLSVGWPRQRETEEGLALVLEGRMNLLGTTLGLRYAGRAIASKAALSKSFFDIYGELVEWFPPDEAFVLALRSKRGLADSSKPGGLIHDHIYLQGKQRIENLESSDYQALYAGRVSIQHLPLIKDMLSKHKLIEPAFVPESFHG